MRPNPKPEPRPKAERKPLARNVGLNRRSRLTARPAAGPVQRSTLKPRSKPRAPRQGNADAPSSTFRQRVCERDRGRCIVTGKHARGYDDRSFEAAHLIPARLFRDEGLGDLAYRTEVAVWMHVDAHRREDSDHDRTLTRALLVERGLWAPLVTLAGICDASVSPAYFTGKGPRYPFAAYLDRRYPEA